MATYNPGNGFTLRSGYGSRPGGPNGNFHYGSDYIAPAGTPIPAAASGSVWYSGTAQGFGNTIIIYHGTNGPNSDENKVFTVYAHMETPSTLKPGDQVSSGQSVGNVGGTGTGGQKVYGNHLHFETIEVPPGGRAPLPGTGNNSTGLKGNPNRKNPAAFDNNKQVNPRLCRGTRKV